MVNWKMFFAVGGLVLYANLLTASRAPSRAGSHQQGGADEDANRARGFYNRGDRDTRPPPVGSSLRNLYPGQNGFTMPTSGTGSTEMAQAPPPHTSYAGDSRFSGSSPAPYIQPQRPSSAAPGFLRTSSRMDYVRAQLPRPQYIDDNTPANVYDRHHPAALPSNSAVHSQRKENSELYATYETLHPHDDSINAAGFPSRTNAPQPSYEGGMRFGSPAPRSRSIAHGNYKTDLMGLVRTPSRMDYVGKAQPTRPQYINNTPEHTYDRPHLASLPSSSAVHGKSRENSESYARYNTSHPYQSPNNTINAADFSSRTKTPQPNHRRRNSLSSVNQGMEYQVESKSPRPQHRNHQSASAANISHLVDSETIPMERITDLSQLTEVTYIINDVVNDEIISDNLSEIMMRVKLTHAKLIDAKLLQKHLNEHTYDYIAFGRPATEEENHDNERFIQLMERMIYYNYSVIIAPQPPHESVCATDNAREFYFKYVTKNPSTRQRLCDRLKKYSDETESSWRYVSAHRKQSEPAHHIYTNAIAMFHYEEQAFRFNMQFLIRNEHDQLTGNKRLQVNRSLAKNIYIPHEFLAAIMQFLRCNHYMNISDVERSKEWGKLLYTDDVDNPYKFYVANHSPKGQREEVWHYLFSAASAFTFGCLTDLMNCAIEATVKSIAILEEQLSESLGNVPEPITTLLSQIKIDLKLRNLTHLGDFQQNYPIKGMRRYLSLASKLTSEGQKEILACTLQIIEEACLAPKCANASCDSQHIPLTEEADNLQNKRNEPSRASGNVVRLTRSGKSYAEIAPVTIQTERQSSKKGKAPEPSKSRRDEYLPPDSIASETSAVPNSALQPIYTEIDWSKYNKFITAKVVSDMSKPRMDLVLKLINDPRITMDMLMKHCNDNKQHYLASAKDIGRPASTQPRTNASGSSTTGKTSKVKDETKPGDKLDADRQAIVDTIALMNLLGNSAAPIKWTKFHKIIDVELIKNLSSPKKLENALKRIRKIDSRVTLNDLQRHCAEHTHEYLLYNRLATPEETEHHRQLLKLMYKIVTKPDNLMSLIGAENPQHVVCDESKQAKKRFFAAVTKKEHETRTQLCMLLVVMSAIIESNVKEDHDGNLERDDQIKAANKWWNAPYVIKPDVRSNVVVSRYRVLLNARTIMEWNHRAILMVEKIPAHEKLGFEKDINTLARKSYVLFNYLSAYIQALRIIKQMGLENGDIWYKLGYSLLNVDNKEEEKDITIVVYHITNHTNHLYLSADQVAAFWAYFRAMMRVFFQACGKDPFDCAVQSAIYSVDILQGSLQEHFTDISRENIFLNQLKADIQTNNWTHSTVIREQYGQWIHKNYPLPAMNQNAIDAKTQTHAKELYVATLQLIDDAYKSADCLSNKCKKPHAVRTFGTIQ